MLDLIIKGGTVVAPEGAALADVGIQGEQIAAVATPGALDEIGAGETIDATGMIVLPGGIEPHAHINVPVPDYWAGGDTGIYTQPPEAASRAAAFGGVTTYVDFAGALPLTPGSGASPADPIMGQIEVQPGHIQVATPSPTTPFTTSSPARSARSLWARSGRRSSPAWPASRYSPHSTLSVPMGHLWEIFQEVGKNGGIMAVHAEEDDIVTYMEDKLEREGRDHGSNLHLAHNNISEDISFRKVTRLAESTETGIYFVHTTAKEGVNAIADARARQLAGLRRGTAQLPGNSPATNYLKPDGLAIHTYPAIKFSDDRDALQQGLVDGPICTTATDEWTTYKNVRLAGDTIRTLCGGPQRHRDPHAGHLHEAGCARDASGWSGSPTSPPPTLPRSSACIRRRAPSPSGSDADIVHLRPQPQEDDHHR